MLMNVKSKVYYFTVILFVVSILLVTCYQWSLYNKYNGNFLVYMELRTQYEDDCIDFTMKVNGIVLVHKDSIGWCSQKFSVDSIFRLPIGINCIEYSSQKLNLYHKEYIINLLFVSGYVEISHLNDSYSIDRVGTKMETFFTYLQLGLM
jgi:hypothetical protein